MTFKSILGALGAATGHLLLLAFTLCGALLTFTFKVFIFLARSYDGEEEEYTPVLPSSCHGLRASDITNEHMDY